MRLSFTLLAYIARNFALAFGVIFLAIVATTLLIETVELLRRAADEPNATLGIVLGMAFLKLPYLAQLLLPFGVLFAGMLCFWRMTRSHELTVMRAAGVSVWQFLMPAIVIVGVLGAVKITVVNPVAAVLYARYEQLEVKYLRAKRNMLAVSPTGFWLRAADGATNSVVHAQRITSQGLELHEAIIFNFQGDERFISRVDAKMARLEPGFWRLQNAWITGPERPAQFAADFRLPTELTPERIQDSFAAPQTISFWDLPSFIRMLDRAGFSAVRHRLLWHSTLAEPLLLFAMVLVAAAFSLRLPRRGLGPTLIAVGVVGGFLLYFMSTLTVALGQSSVIPVMLAAWVPALVSMLIGISLLLHLEDG